MENKHRILVLEIRDTVKGEEVLYRYLADPNDPQFDDLLSELLQPGIEYFLTFTPVKPQTQPEFNTSEKKKS